MKEKRKEENKKLTKIKKENNIKGKGEDKKLETQGSCVDGKQKGRNKKNIKAILDKYISSNKEIPQNKTINDKTENKNFKNKKSGKILNNNENKIKMKSNNLNINNDNIKNRKNNDNEEKLLTEKRVNNKKNRKVFNHIRIINIDTKKNKSNKLFKIEGNKSLERSYDNILPKKRNNTSDYKKIFKTFNINKSLKLSKRNHNLSSNPKNYYLDIDKKINKTIRTINSTNYLKTKKIDITPIPIPTPNPTPTRNIRKNMKNRIVIDNSLRNIVNSTDNIFKNKNVNTIKLNLIKKQINFNKNDYIKESYTNQYIKKAISKENKKMSQSKTQKASLKNSISHIKKYINNINNRSFKNSLKNIELYNSNRKINNKIKREESPIFQTLNTLNKNNSKTSLKLNDINKSYKNRNIINTSIQIKEKRKGVRKSLMNENKLINKTKYSFGIIKKNNTDFINNTYNFDINKLNANTIYKNEIDSEYYE